MQEIESHVEYLYGKHVASSLFARINQRLTQFHAAQDLRELPAMNERDALLITYPDQLQEPGEPSLQTLNDFLSTRVAGAISCVHLLPFYPSSSDDGFAVKDFLAVDPAFG